MITVSILEATDCIEPTDWCRPLNIISMSGGHSDYYSFRNTYSGTPENNAKWTEAKRVIGHLWMGRTVGEFNRLMHSTGLQYEFIRGSVPHSHRLNMKGYTDLSKLGSDLIDDANDDIPF